MRQARDLPPKRTAIVHPCNIDAIQAVLEATDEGLITPVLIGPAHKIHAAADAAGLSIAGIELETTEHSHAAAERAACLAATGKVEALMKGSLHTDELLGAVIAPQSGLRTERRISHVYVRDVPTYPKPLIITDAAINIAPALLHKRDICQNAIDLLHLLGVEEPLVAILAAIETIDPAMQATLDAAALTVMAKRGQITGARVDGPLAFDNAIYHRSGLLGVSGISADSRVLLASERAEAREALELFAFRIAREVAAIANTIGGLDGPVFTAGIGEHQPQIRAAVCVHLSWLGVQIDTQPMKQAQPGLRRLPARLPSLSSQPMKNRSSPKRRTVSYTPLRKSSRQTIASPCSWALCEHDKYSPAARALPRQR